MKTERPSLFSRILSLLAGIAILLTLWGGWLYLRYSQVPRGELQLHFLDVGQADCALVKSGEHYMLIDAGDAQDGRRIVTYLRRHGVRRLDVFVATHPHADHIGGAAYVLDHVAADRVYLSPWVNNTDVYYDMMDKLDECGIEYLVPRTGESFALGRAAVTFVGNGDNEDSANNASLVLRVDFGDDSALFTGDIEWGAEQDLVDDGAHLDADLLKVPHHGSESSSSQVFLDCVTPEIAVISVGADNPYGHPSPGTLSRLDCWVCRTDQLGNIVYDSDGSGLTFVDEDALYPHVYIANTRTGVYHRLDCDALPKWRSAKVYFHKKQVEEAGFRPCGRCYP